jgi:alkylhydroperoxidase family enzyme
LLGDRELVRAVLHDFAAAPLTDTDRALLVFVDKVNLNPGQIGKDDVDAVKRAGWSDEAIYDAVTVCALFNFYNRWIDGTGVHDMPASAYELSGKRLKEFGYHGGGKSEARNPKSE